MNAGSIDPNFYRDTLPNVSSCWLWLKVVMVKNLVLSTCC